MSLRERAATESARTQSRQWKHRGKPRPTTTTLYPIFTPQGFQPNPTNPTLSLIPSQLIQGRPPRPGTATFPQQHQPNHRPLIQRTLDGKIATTVPAKKPKSRKPHRGPRPQTPTLSRKPRRQKQARPLRPSQLKHRSPPPPPTTTYGRHSHQPPRPLRRYISPPQTLQSPSPGLPEHQ